ncbi:succinate dehydrogenase assembly factor 2 [Abyssibius alkaniclasticus]|uniref:succinate dehydrogenase assembly factor 2 n=1 Tax=Abyssibius alkaniclasticus TaxID=2881234 RepID=UPI004059662C
MSAEPHEIRLKRLRIRSWRRGMKEMDLLLGPFSDGSIAALSHAELDAYEALLEENDQDLYRWFSGASPMPDDHAAIIARIQKSRN